MPAQQKQKNKRKWDGGGDDKGIETTLKTWRKIKLNCGIVLKTPPKELRLHVHPKCAGKPPGEQIPEPRWHSRECPLAGPHQPGYGQ